jgi:hypothetical protein
MNGFGHAAGQKEFPDEDHAPLVVVSIGRPGPDAWLGRSPRRDAAEVVTTL